MTLVRDHAAVFGDVFVTLCRLRGGELVYTCRVVHSIPLTMSAVQIFVADNMVAVSHLIGNDQLPAPSQVQQSNTLPSRMV